MGSYQFLSFLIFIPLLLLSVSPSHSSPDNNVAVEAAGPVISSKVSYKIDLIVYYESLCPYCKNFIVGSLANAVETDLMHIVNLKLVPWGNAVLQDNQTIVCQHGEDECYLNMIHACGINLWPDLKTHFKFIKCIESGADTSWDSCAYKLGLSRPAIEECYYSGHGKELVLQYGKETDQLHPPHEYVPWVVVGDKPIYEDYENFADYVCKAYKGQPLPKSCSSTNKIDRRPIQTACHVGEARSSKDQLMHTRNMEPSA